MASRYASELIYSLAFSSLAVHLLWQRRAADTERRRLGTQISILEEISTRLRAGERIPDAEYTRLRRLGHEGEVLEKDRKEEEDIGWRDMLFGRTETAQEKQGAEEWDRRDLENVQRELHGSAKE
ncbi:hypothetical protein DENSPDRAFT_879715 [Dentipellis sp. KUC8613]|nr:hypothetical protein DENSPDRAFT_879715 [Dentipellis sp. KUC8613]